MTCLSCQRKSTCRHVHNTQRGLPASVIPLSNCFTMFITGCAPLYKLPQTKWTRKLTLQMTIYASFICLSMGVGGLLPTLLARSSRDKAYSSEWRKAFSALYLNHSDYSFCPPRTLHYSKCQHAHCNSQPLTCMKHVCRCLSKLQPCVFCPRRRPGKQNRPAAA